MNLTKGKGYESLAPGVAYTFIGRSGTQFVAGDEFAYIFPDNRAWLFHVDRAYGGGTYETTCVGQCSPDDLAPEPSPTPPMRPAPAAAVAA